MSDAKAGRLPPESPAWLRDDPTAAPVFSRAVWPAVAPAPRDDRVIASIALGLFLSFSILGIGVGAVAQIVLRAFYTARGSGYVESTSVVPEQVGIIVSQIVLFAASAVITVALMRRGRRSFHVPLLLGLLAALIFWLLAIPLYFGGHDATFVA